MVRKHSHSKKHSAPKHRHAKHVHHSAASSMSAMSPVFAPVSAPMRSGSAGEGRVFWALFTMVAIALIVVIILRLLAKKGSTTTSAPAAAVVSTTMAAVDAVKNNKGLFFGISGGAIVLFLVVVFLIMKYGRSSGLADKFEMTRIPKITRKGVNAASRKTYRGREEASRVATHLSEKVRSGFKRINDLSTEGQRVNAEWDVEKYNHGTDFAKDNAKMDVRSKR